jgi:ribosomal protein L40E
VVKKTVGYVELQWTCPQCESLNPGTTKVCSSCGAAQPDNVEFHQAAQETLIADEAKIARAKAGPDIHCGYCGARNPSTSTKCSQCGGDLTAGAARQAGRVVGAHRDKPAPEVSCPHCGAPNPATALECSKCGGALKPVAPARPAPAAQPARKLSPLAIIGIAVAVLVGLALCMLLIFSSPGGDMGTPLPTPEPITGTVQSVAWERSIVILGLSAVPYEAWEDEIPTGATQGACVDRYHHTQPDPAPRATEVCGTPYVVDTGTGVGEVVQDCEYEVHDDWCQYTVEEWAPVNIVTIGGSDLAPQWPDASAAAGQREGEREESYQVVFATEEGTFTYPVSGVGSFSQFDIGSRWVLYTDRRGNITSIEPAP